MRFKWVSYTKSCGQTDLRFFISTSRTMQFLTHIEPNIMGEYIGITCNNLWLVSQCMDKELCNYANLFTLVQLVLSLRTPV
jgi:hypothetical protein